MSEIEPSARAVLEHRYPGTPLHGDFTTIKAGQYAGIDILVGGTPCQSFSVAGLRGGMADARGNLALEFLRLAERLRPRWVLWENVPGVLSSEGGRDFGSFVGGLAECGYGWAYRVLDAQYFGLAQRRKRVFVVGHLGDWRRAAAVLFEPASLRGDSAPRRTQRERVAAGLTRGADSSGKGGYTGRRREDDDNLIANAIDCDARHGGNPERGKGNLLVAKPLGAKRDGGWRGDLDNDTFAITDTLRDHPRPGSNTVGNIAVQSSQSGVRLHDTHATLDANNGSRRHNGVLAPAISSNPYGDHESREGLLVAHSLRAAGSDASEDGTGRGTPLVFNGKASAHQSMNPGPVAPSLEVGKSDGVCVYDDIRRFDAGGIHGGIEHGNLHPPLNTVNSQHITRIQSAVRRLTPRECERLQGFPDDYTLIPYRGKPMADGPRYRLLGNSMAVPCMAWIGRRIQEVHPKTKETLP